MFLPTILFVFIKFIGGISVAFLDNVSKEILIPGAITPPLYSLPITTSNVVAVPKSITITDFL